MYATNTYDRTSTMDQQQQQGFTTMASPKFFPGGLPPPLSPRTPPQGVPPQQSMFKPFDQSMELVDCMVERFMQQDNSYPSLIDRMRITCDSGVTTSGNFDFDYPNPLEYPVQVQVNQLRIVNKVPLPIAVLEQVGHISEHTPMGLFPEINRAWLSTESDIYIWNYETGTDVACFDGLNDVISSVGLIKPKPGVFQEFISHLLIITTPSEIVALGVYIAKSPDGKSDEMQLTPEIIYSLPTDGVPIKVIKGTSKGRIFLGGRDGSLYELVYQKDIGWWGKRCKKVNHSKSTLSYFIPAFVAGAFSGNDSIIDIVVDNSRNILYTLTCFGTIGAYDLGPEGTDGPSCVATCTHNHLTSFTKALNTRILETSRVNSSHHPELPEVTQIVALVALTEMDSPHLGLVGLTREGIRLYFTTGSPPPHRPSTLRILHMRFPPRGGLPSGLRSTGPAGLTTHQTSPPFLNDSLTAVTQKSGSFILTTTNPSSMQNKVWCFSSDYFPLKMGFFEDVQFHNLTSPALAMGEMSTNTKFMESGTTGHILVQQQNINPNRFVLLTPQGTEVYEKLRPVDILAEILRERSGPDCEEVKQYFHEFGTDQACAMALILACTYLSTHPEMAEWATRAFFLYGGDPKEVIQPMQQLGLLQYSIPHTFRPNQVSTPQSQPRLSQATLNSPQISSQCPVDAFAIQLSSKHNGLYLYLVRLLRPIWMEKVVIPVRLEDNKVYFTSSLIEEDVSLIAARLCSLKAFLEKNTAHNDHIGQGPPGRENPMDKTVNPGSLRLQEKTSLDALKSFVEHATQVFGLWKVLCQHRIHFIIENLKPEQKAQLTSSSYRDLVLCGKDICSSLINKLINLYLNDNASVDSISTKLRDVCPSLYKSEDATCSKINEILMSVKDVRDEEQKLIMLRSAIKLCKEVLPLMNHSLVCKQLVAHKYYDGVIEVCRDAANKADPSDLSSSFVSKNERPDDQAGSKAYSNRCNAYKELGGMLDDLYIQCQLGSNSLSLDGSSPSQTKLEEVITKCLALEDEAAHTVVYDWLVTRNLQASLVKFGRPSLERYLLHYPPDSGLRDLLWQYHERTGNHSRAAHILYKLATSRGDGIKLHQRLSYLGKAVMCMRSDSVGCAPNLGVFLHELEDLVQVARIQKQVFDRISSLVPTNALAEEAVKKLNSNLLSITELFEEYAEPFNLWECKLTILDCAGHDDSELIRTIWDEIIRKELTQCIGSPPEEQMTILMSKVKSLGLQFPQSSCFPVYHLVGQLEIISCRLKVNKAHVHSTMFSIGVKIGTLLDIYDKLFSANDRCWRQEGNELHLTQVIASFADSFAENPRVVTNNERKSIIVRMQDLITKCLSTLYSKPDSNQFISYLKTIQTKLNRIN